ncbi:MAG: dephospho-CoA kinase [Sulfurovum sp.]|nr:dephospho-CoA kinase [Sulfurovum sp.]
MVKAFAYAIALTGSIATGKSSVARHFRLLGFEVIDADTLGHEILNQQHQCIATLFGQALVTEGKVDRKALGAIIFDDKSKRERLEALLHPLIYQAIEERALALDSKKQVYFVDIPLFFEGNRYPIGKVLVVYTPPSVQLQRLMQRDKSSQEEAQKRIDSQIAIEEKVKNAEYVIDNSGTLRDLEKNCIEIKHTLLGALSSKGERE